MRQPEIMLLGGPELLQLNETLKGNRPVLGVGGALQATGRARAAGTPPPTPSRRQEPQLRSRRGAHRGGRASGPWGRPESWREGCSVPLPDQQPCVQPAPSGAQCRRLLVFTAAEPGLFGEWTPRTTWETRWGVGPKWLFCFLGYSLEGKGRGLQCPGALCPLDLTGWIGQVLQPALHAHTRVHTLAPAWALCWWGKLPPLGTNVILGGAGTSTASGLTSRTLLTLPLMGVRWVQMWTPGSKGFGDP